MTKFRSSLTDLFAGQSSWNHNANPVGFAAVQSQIARALDPGGVMAMQSQIARALDPGGVVAIQRKIAQLIDPGGVIATQGRLAQALDPGGIMAAQKRIAQALDPSGLMSMQSQIARLMDPGGVMSMQSQIARKIDLDSVIAAQRRIARLTGQADITAMQTQIARYASIGALRLATNIVPGTSIKTLADAVRNALASPLGRSALTIATASPQHTQIVSDALSALTALNLSDQGAVSLPNEEDQTPLVAAVSELRAAIDRFNSVGDLEAVVERIAAKLRPKESSSFLSAQNLSLIISFFALLATLVFGALSELRAARQEVASDQSQIAVTERLSRFQGALDRLVELQRRTDGSTGLVTVGGQIAPANTQFVVRRAVALRQKSGRRSPSLCTLPPGTVVELIGRRGRQLKVRRFDPLVGREQVGWVLRKYLVRIDR